MLAHMQHAVRGSGGIAALYWGYAPFLFKALPYDVAELFTYSQLSDRRMQLPFLRHMPNHYVDMFVGEACPLCQWHAATALMAFGMAHAPLGVDC